MAVMMFSEVNGQTLAGYEHLLAKVRDAMTVAPGFHMHTSHPTDSGWRVIEVWESREHAGQFFATHIAPMLPDGIRPKLSFEPLHDVVAPADPTG